MKNCICHIGFKGARTLAGRITLLLLLAGAVLWPGQPLHAASRRWTGDDSGRWSDPDNWFPVGLPQNGDSLTFPAVGPLDATSMVNDLTGLTVDNMTFTAGGYTLNGNALTFIQGITDNHTSGGLNIVRCNIQFSGVRGRFNSLSSGLLEINGTTTLVNNQELIITPVVANLTVSGAIVGSGSLIKRDDGELFLRGNANNTYSGATRVEGGALHLAKTGAARAISADVIIHGTSIGNASLVDELPGQYPPAISMVITNRGDWTINNGATVTNFFVGDNCHLYGDGLLNLECNVTAQGYCNMYCPVNLGNQSRTLLVKSIDLGDSLAIYNHILGAIGGTPSGIIKTGSGRLYLAAQNTYVGPTVVKEGELLVGHNGALGSTSLGGETRLRGGRLVIAGGTLTCPEPIVVDSDSSIGFSGTNTLTGPITLNAKCSFWGDRNSDFLELRNTIDGPGGLPDSFGPGGLQVWKGIVRLSGLAPNTFGGGTLVAAPGLGGTGTLELAKPDNVMAVPGEVSIRGYGAPAGEAFLRQLQNDGVTDVSVGHHGAWLLNGHGVVPTALTFKGAGYVDTQGGVLFLFNSGTHQLHALPAPSPLPSNYTAQIFGLLALGANTNDIVVEAGVTLDVQARMASSSTVAKERPGTLRLNSSNNFTGPLLVNEGTLIAAHKDAFGNTAVGTFVNNNASLALEGGITVGFEPLTLNTTNAAALASLGPVTNVWRGDVTLQRTASIAVPDSTGVMRFESFFGCCPSFITGPGGLTKSGPGAMAISGTIANNYTGRTTVNDGVLEASRTQGPALSSNVVVSGANAILRTGRSAAPQSLPTAARMTVQDGALWTMNPITAENLSSLLGDGRLEIGAGATLTLSNSVSCTFSGQLSGTGALNKYGLASFRVTGNSPGYTGPATVVDGTYKVDGQLLNSRVTVKASSILRGTGAAGDVVVESGGVVFADSDGPGRLGGEFVMNSASFQSGGVLGLAFYGPHPTGGNDSLFVNNGVTLSSSSLSSGFRYAPRDGDVITLINKNAAGPVIGAFSGFPEGVLRLIGGVPVVMSYVGGGGNDVTLTVTNLPLREGGAQLVSSDGGGAFRPDDCSQLRLIVTNRGSVVTSGLRGTLRSLTAGVTVTQGESPYPALAPAAGGANLIPFQIRTESTFACGGGAQFELVLTSSNLPPMSILYTLAGASGFGLTFDGRGDRVQLPVNAFPAVSNNFTIELWAHPAANRTETVEATSGVSGVNVAQRQLQRFAVFPDRGDSSYGANHVGAGLSIGRNGVSVYEHATDFLPSRLVYSNNLSGWTHVALVYANRRPRLYVNGRLVRSSTLATAAFIHASGSLGGSSQSVNYGDFDGQLDEVRIWNVALSEGEIQTNMSRSLTGTEPGLVTYFRCNEGSGGTLVDNAPAAPNRNGTLTDGAAFAFPGVVPFGESDCQSGGGACESCHVVAGQFDDTAVESLRVLNPTSGPSICLPAKPCPGFEERPANNPVRHRLHHFTNSSPTEVCVSAQLHACPDLASASLATAAYTNAFLADQPCISYLGDDAATGEAFSFRVPPQAELIVVVTARDTNLTCTTYTLELHGLPCPPPTLHIARVAETNQVRLEWSSAYPDYRLRSANALNNPHPPAFEDFATRPILSGGRFTVTNAAVSPSQFFQLMK